MSGRFDGNIPAATHSTCGEKPSFRDQPGLVAMCRALGIVHLQGELAATLPALPCSLNRAAPNAFHMGAILALIDQTAGHAVATRNPGGGAQATISLRIEWIGEPLGRWPVRCDVEDIVIAAGAAHVTVNVTGGPDGAMIARAAGTFILGVSPGGSTEPQMFDSAPATSQPTCAPDFQAFLGLDASSEDVLLLPSDEHVGHPGLPALHGGITAAALHEVAATAGGRGRIAQSSITYLRPIRADASVRVRTEILLAGRSMACVRTSAFQGGKSLPAAIGETILLRSD